MRQHLALGDLLSSKSQLAILRTLVLFPHKEYSGRELSRTSRVSLSQTQHALDGFLRGGIVERRTVGRTHQWRIVEQKLFVGPLRDMFKVEQASLASLKRELALALRGQSFRRARIFGSVARGRERVDSDLDFYVEVPDEKSEQRVTRALESVQVNLSRKYGISVNPMVVVSSRKTLLNPNVLRDVEVSGLPIEGGDSEP